MLGYIERERETMSMGDTIQYSIYKQLINDWARARNNEQGP